MRAILTLALKDLRVLSRDRFGLFWMFVFPLVIALFFGTVFGGDGARGEIPIVIVDENESDASQRLIEKLGEAGGLSIDAAETDLDIEAARDLVRKGERVAYVRIPEHFSGDAFSMFAGADNQDADSIVEIGIDPARSAERGLLEGVVTQSVFQSAFGQFGDDEAMTSQIERTRASLRDATDISATERAALDSLMTSLDTLVRDTDINFGGPAADAAEGDGEGDGAGGGMAATTNTIEVTRDTAGRPRSSYDVTFPSAIAWALIGCVATFSVSMVHEHTLGTMLRLRVAPVSLAQVLAGKALACFLACMTVSATLLMIGWLGLGVQISNLPLLLAALVCSGVCFTGIMMAISVVGKTERAVAGAGWGVMMPLAMIGGGMIPIMAMPSWLLTASHFSPFKWTILFVEGAIWRELSPGELVLPAVVLVGVGVICFGLGVVIFKRTID